MAYKLIENKNGIDLMHIHDDRLNHDLRNNKKVWESKLLEMKKEAMFEGHAKIYTIDLRKDVDDVYRLAEEKELERVIEILDEEILSKSQLNLTGY